MEDLDIMVERDASGSWRLSARAKDGLLLKRKYMLYSKAEAIELFKQYYKNRQNSIEGKTVWL